jgi:hypothetical protein
MDVNMSKSLQKWQVAGGLVLLALVMFHAIFVRGNASFSIAQFSEPDSYVAAPELIEGVEYVQSMTCFCENITSIGFQFANYSNRPNTGTVGIIVMSDGNQIASKQIDASTITDGGYISVVLDATPELGSLLKIQISADSQPGQAVTVWLTRNEPLSRSGASLSIDGASSEFNLNMSLGYRDIKLPVGFWYILVVCVFLSFVLGLPQYIYSKLKNNVRAKRMSLYMLLLAIGTVLFSLRSLVFVSTPIFYGESAFFLSRQLENGFIQTLFLPRGGIGANDFINMGVYLLTGLAEKTNSLLNGYDLSYFPFWDGVYANIFFAFTAISAFRAFELLVDRRCGIFAYFMVVFVPMNNSAVEVFGRSLNTSFMWTVTVAMLLIIQYKKNNAISVTGFVVSLICFIGTFTFPICFAEIGVYLMFEFVRSLKNRNLKETIIGNFVHMITLAIGVYMLPMLSSAQGLNATFTYKSESLIEFAFARHILYPFLAPIYSLLTDSKVIVLIIVFFVFLLAAAVMKIKRDGYLFNSFSLLTLIFAVAAAASIYTRRNMTALFDNYASTFPDRYYYGVNLLSMLLVLYAVYIVFERVKKVNVKRFASVGLLCALILNPYLFELTKKTVNGHLTGGAYAGDFSEQCRQSLQSGESVLGQNVRVNVYPTGLSQEFPLLYVVETAASPKI